jgi:murein L,D-transpeptidase YcbB/YkuD
LLLVAATTVSLPGVPPAPSAAGAGGGALPELAQMLSGDPALAALYAARGNRPLWTEGQTLRPAAHLLLRMLRDADTDGPTTERHGYGALAREPDSVEDATKRDIALSRAYADFLRDLRKSAPAARMIYVDRELTPEQEAAALLTAAARAPSLEDHVARTRKMHPIYSGLRRALGDDSLSAGELARVRVNLDRARALPADGRRHIVVDAASARLWLYEGGQVIDSMRVVVGKTGMQTPALAGLIRFAVLSPYWNIPPDLVRQRAQRILAEGTEILIHDRLELLSDWGPSPRVLDPDEIDWAGVADGTVRLRMRQLPGPDNMMGNIKFMLPNPLGIYLHDTPDKSAFARDDRRISSGCVRVEDANRLAKWLFGGTPPTASGKPEQRVDLPHPIAVYITYFTALPDRGRVRFQPDPYNRDTG